MSLNTSDILALIARAPQKEADLITAFYPATPKAIKTALSDLGKAGSIRRVGSWHQERWALVRWAPPVVLTPAEQSAPGWWVATAQPEQRAEFIVAAHKRDVAMAHDATWRKLQKAYPETPA